MPLEVGDIAAADRVRMQVRRGDHLRARFELYQDPSAPSTFGCGVVAQGPPLDLSSYEDVVASGEVVGTGAFVLVSATLIDKGAVNRPAVVAVFVDGANIERVFDEGAQQAFTLEVKATRPGARDTIIVAEVDVEDGAFGAVR